MTRIRTLLVGATLTLASLGPAAAQAIPFGFSPHLDFESGSTLGGAEHDVRSYPSCVGQLNGTAHESCGTRTGGPSGGLL